MRLMKLRRTYLYFVSAAFILLAGCESDYENRYPFDNAAYIDVAETSSDNNVTFKKTVTQLDRELSAVLISPATPNTTRNMRYSMKVTTSSPNGRQP